MRSSRDRRRPWPQAFILNAKVLVGCLAAAAVVGGAASQAQPSTHMSTKDFVQAAQASDLYEIEAGQVALIQSRDPRIRAFARQMIQDHARTTQALRQAALASGVTPPPIGLADDGQKFLSQLQSLSGPDFDTAYQTQQGLAHQSALVVAQAYAATGSDPDVRRAARAAVPIIQQHLSMTQQMQSTRQ